MGRPPPPPTPPPPTTSVLPEDDEDSGAVCCGGCCGGGNRCCARSSWYFNFKNLFCAKFESHLPIRSWLLYVLVLASLSLSILVFWLSLYKSQEAGMAVRALREEQNETVAKLVDARLAELR